MIVKQKIQAVVKENMRMAEMLRMKVAERRTTHDLSDVTKL